MSAFTSSSLLITSRQYTICNHWYFGTAIGGGGFVMGCALTSCVLLNPLQSDKYKDTCASHLLWCCSSNFRCSWYALFPSPRVRKSVITLSSQAYLKYILHWIHTLCGLISLCVTLQKASGSRMQEKMVQS